MIRAAAALALLATPAAAEMRVPSNCAPDRDKLVAHLGARWDERPRFWGLMADGSALELLLSDDGSTWTAIVTRPGGMACAAATGRDGMLDGLTGDPS